MDTLYQTAVKGFMSVTCPFQMQAVENVLQMLISSLKCHHFVSGHKRCKPLFITPLNTEVFGVWSPFKSCANVKCNNVMYKYIVSIVIKCKIVIVSTKCIFELCQSYEGQNLHLKN